jgi:hypothetical protein
MGQPRTAGAIRQADADIPLQFPWSKTPPIFRKQPLAGFSLGGYFAGLMKARLIRLTAATAVLFTTSFAHAAFLTPGFSGTTQYDGWNQSGLSGASNPGYPGFMTGANAWPSPIGSNLGSDATFNKLSGEGFPTNGFGGGIYVFTGGPGAGTGGDFKLLDSTPVTSLKTVLFQIDLEGVGTGWQDYFTGLTLNYNGGAQGLTHNFQTIFSTGAPLGGGTRQIVAFQWDLSAVSGSITSYDISWHSNEHSLFYGVQLDQSDTMLQVVPEPSTWLMVLVGVGLLLAYRRRFRSEPNTGLQR